MSDKVAYMILEIGWEYNDEYYHTNNNGETYEKPNVIFLDEKEAKVELLKRERKEFKGKTLGSYIYELNRQLTKGTTEEDVKDYFMKTWNEDIDDEQFEIPSKATDAEIDGLLKLIKIRFFILHKVKIN